WVGTACSRDRFQFVLSQFIGASVKTLEIGHPGQPPVDAFQFLRDLLRPMVDVLDFISLHQITSPSICSGRAGPAWIAIRTINCYGCSTLIYTPRPDLLQEMRILTGSGGWPAHGRARPGPSAVHNFPLPQYLHGPSPGCGHSFVWC